VQGVGGGVGFLLFNSSTFRETFKQLQNYYEAGRETPELEPEIAILDKSKCSFVASLEFSLTQLLVARRKVNLLCTGELNIERGDSS
jgi:hypothetical protein